MIRTLYPIDLLPLLLSPGRLPPNQGIDCGGLSKRSPTSPEALLEHWLPLKTRRHTWVFVERGRIVGLVSLRDCGHPAAWRIDCLQSDGEQCLALLDRVSAAASTERVRKLFLRLLSDSPLTHQARRSGFSPYKADYVYRLKADPFQATTPNPQQYGLRPASKSDDYRLFGLYTAVVPAPVRTAEGMTLTEWQETRDRPAWPEQHREFVLGTQESITGWLRVKSFRESGCFCILCHESDGESLELLMKCAIRSLHAKSSIFCVAYAFQQRLLRLLEDLGFEQMAECSSLMKEMTVKATQPHFMPVRA